MLTSCRRCHHSPLALGCVGKKNGKKNYGKYLGVHVGWVKTLLRSLSKAAEATGFTLTSDFLLEKIAEVRAGLRVNFEASTSPFAEAAAKLEKDGVADFPQHAAKGFRGLTETLNAMPKLVPATATGGMAASTGVQSTPKSRSTLCGFKSHTTPVTAGKICCQCIVINQFRILIDPRFVLVWQ